MLYLKTIFYLYFVFSVTFFTDLFWGISEIAFFQIMYWGLLLAAIYEWLKALTLEGGENHVEEEKTTEIPSK